MTNKQSKRMIAGRLGLALALACGGAVMTCAPQAHAQGTVRRTVEGRVRSKTDSPLKGAVVYLKDSRTLAVKSFIADDEGTFHFGQLSQSTDYEVYAEFEGKRSKVKKISSFDSKNDFDFTLVIEG